MIIAGHTFDFFGICTLPQRDGSCCPVKLSWLEEQCFENPDTKMKTGYAHVDHLAVHEYEQIQVYVTEKRKRAYEATYAAVGRPVHQEGKSDAT